MRHSGEDTRTLSEPEPVLIDAESIVYTLTAENKKMSTNKRKQCFDLIQSKSTIQIIQTVTPFYNLLKQPWFSNIKNIICKQRYINTKYNKS